MKNWVKGVDYPDWMQNEGVTILKGDYTMEGENPFQMYRRVAKAAAENVNKPQLEEIFYDYLTKGWLCPATPVLTNLGTNRGLPISCYGTEAKNTMSSIGGIHPELMKLSQLGGGVGIGVDNIQAKGTKIKRGGISNGAMQFIKAYDSTIASSAQGSGQRRGAASVNMDITHGDFYDFCGMRRITANSEIRCEKINHCVIISDEFMRTLRDVENPNCEEYRKRWDTLLKTRQEEGEPYIMFKDTINRANPIGYKKLGLKVNMTNICTEITQTTDANHSFICALSSLNLAKWDEWKDTDLVYNSVLFLEGVLNEFITKLSKIIDTAWKKYTEDGEISELSNLYLQKVLKSAIKGRSIGLGVLGWHTLLQKKELPFISIQSNALNKIIFKKINEAGIRASRDLAIEFGEPEWCVGSGQRHSHVFAVAPTISNATIMGTSYSIEPMVANIFAQISAKGTFIRTNPQFEAFMLSKYPEHYTAQVKDSIIENMGSVAHLDFLSQYEKSIFLTAYEINQKDLISQAADRQPYICQAQSVNLFIRENPDDSPTIKNNWMREIHYYAWEKGLKTLYYLRADVANKGDMASNANRGGCSMCEG